MLYQKPATAIEEQLTRLGERGMGWTDEALVRRWLETVGYYRLSIYWYPMEEDAPPDRARSRIFRAGAQFDDVIDTYVFDRKLRLLVLEATERVEIGVRSRWTNRMTLAGGAHAHLDPARFSSATKHATRLVRLAAQYDQSGEPFVTHYKRKYTQGPDVPPLWMATELLTFGELSKWVELTKNTKLVKAVARDMGLPTRDLLVGLLECLNYVRNVCAHHNRLWNRSLTLRPPKVRSVDASLVRDADSPTELDRRLYNVLVLLAHVLRTQSPDTSWPQRVADLCREAGTDRRSAMGFPEDWETRPVWDQAASEG